MTLLTASFCIARAVLHCTNCRTSSIQIDALADRPQIDSVFLRTAPEARGDRHHIWIKARARALLIIAIIFLLVPTARAADTELAPWSGGALPAFTLDNLDGGRTTLAQLRGRVILVHFFATWCEPCRAELDALQRLTARTSGRPFSVLAVDVGEVDERVRRFFQTQRVDFPVLLDRDRAVAKAWQVYALPTTVMLDADLTPRFIAEGDRKSVV